MDLAGVDGRRLRGRRVRAVIPPKAGPRGSESEETAGYWSTLVAVRSSGAMTRQAGVPPGSRYRYLTISGYTAAATHERGARLIMMPTALFGPLPAVKLLPTARCPLNRCPMPSTHQTASCAWAGVRPTAFRPSAPRCCQATARGPGGQPRATHSAEKVQNPQSPSKTSNSA